jgi:serine/threonine protein kinase
MPAPIEVLADATTALARDADAAAALGPLGVWRAGTWRKALLELPLDERGFHDRFQVRRRDAIGSLWRWWSAREPGEAGAETAGYLGFYLLTLVAMHCSDRARFHSESAASVALADTDAAAISERLVADADVRHVVERLYHPRLGRPRSREAERAPSPQTLDRWKEIDFGSLAFHRHGTTSIILTSARAGDGGRPQFALKCLIYPYQKQPAIAAATRSYRDRYGKGVSTTSPLVKVWASHDSWILMEFLPGQTLAERLRERPRAPHTPRRAVIRPIDVAELDHLGTALLTALSRLEQEGHHHDDLTPSNIIVVHEEGDLDKPRMRLIDLGVNHLHTRTLSGAAEGEAAYVAPEVRAEGAGDERADLYSLGRLLLAISGADLNADGTLPDHSYVLSTGMARLFEDLVDADPDRRLLVTRIEPGQNRYRQIGALFQHELEVLHEGARMAPVGWLEKVRGLSPGAGTVTRQSRILAVRKSRTADSAHLRQARRLTRWAWLSAFVLWSTAAVVMMWWARDLGIAWQAKWFELLNNVFNRDGPGMVFFDDIRAADYDIPDPWDNLPSRLVGASFALVNARLYLNVFAELSPLSSLRRGGMLRFRTVVTEVALRSMAILPSVCVLAPTLVQRDWWPLATQVGLVWTVVVISVCIGFERDTHRRAREEGLSTVPEGEFPPGRLVRWRPTLLVYCVAVLSIGTLIMLDVVQDELVYAGFVTLINIAIYYFKSAGADAPRVRTELSRAFLAAERLDHVRARREAAVPRERRRAPEDEDEAALVGA